MAEVLNSPPVCSYSMYRNSHQTHSYYCSTSHDFRIRYSAYFNLGLKIKLNCAKNHAFGVVALLEGSRASLKTAKERTPESLLVYKLSKSRNSCVMPNKVASLEFESACEENGSQKIFPPWDDSAGDEDFNNQDISDHHSKTSKKVDEIEVEVYYLEERNEELLSQRMLKLSRSNKVRSALALYKSMEISGLLPNSHACNSLLTCLLRNKRLNDALKVFDFMKSNEIITGHTYSLILKAVANSCSHEAALTMFEEAEQDEKAKKYMDTIVYNTMIAVFAKVDDWVRVNRIWQSLKQNNLVGTEVTYRLLVCIFVRCCQNELALDAYHEMIRNGLSPDNDSMEAIIGACTREGRWDIALEVLEAMMMKSDCKPSLIACNALINSLGKGAKVELSFKVYDLMKSLGYSPDAYTWNGLICALNRANKHTDAIRLFESVRKQQKSVMNVHIYNTCLMSCQRLGLWEKAMKLLWEMEGSGFPVSVTSYNLVIGACEAGKKPEVALQVYDHMVRLKQSPDVFTRLSLIRSCIWGSLWDEVDEILNAEPNGSLYNAAIQGASLTGKACLARKMYAKMREIGLTPDGKTRALMLQNLPKG